MVPKKPGMISTEYARQAYKDGLALEEKLGVNPFKFGLAAGTDNHTGLTTAEENNWFGKFPSSEPSPDRWSENAFDFEGRVIKGWVDAAGKTRETVYDVVWGNADQRKRGADGRIPPVGNTVDPKTATWRNTIGEPELITVWSDPDFDPKLRAFYYARVLEIPTPRWTLYDSVRFGIKMGPEVTMTLQERAYTSPIWYSPR